MDALKIVLRAVSAIYGSFFEPVDIKRVGVERKSRGTACTHAGAITNLVDRVAMRMQNRYSGPVEPRYTRI